MAAVVHVDLCTNRSGLDNSTHQSRPHNPFLKDRTKGRQQSGLTAQHNDTEQQKTGETKMTTHKHDTRWQKEESTLIWSQKQVKSWLLTSEKTDYKHNLPNTGLSQLDAFGHPHWETDLDEAIPEDTWHKITHAIFSSSICLRQTCYTRLHCSLFLRSKLI